LTLLLLLLLHGNRRQFFAAIVNAICIHPQLLEDSAEPGTVLYICALDTPSHCKFFCSPSTTAWTVHS